MKMVKVRFSWAAPRRCQEPGLDPDGNECSHRKRIRKGKEEACMADQIRLQDEI